PPRRRRSPTAAPPPIAPPPPPPARPARLRLRLRSRSRPRLRLWTRLRSRLRTRLRSRSRLRPRLRSRSRPRPRLRSRTRPRLRTRMQPRPRPPPPPPAPRTPPAPPAPPTPPAPRAPPRSARHPPRRRPRRPAGRPSPSSSIVSSAALLGGQVRQRHAQRGARARQPRLHRADIDLERPRDLGVLHSVNLPEQKRRPVPRRQRPHRAGHPRAQRRAPGALVGARRRLRRVLRQRHRAPRRLRPAQLVDRPPRRDRQDPGRQPRRAERREAAQRAEHRQERLLRQVLGPVAPGRAEHAAKEREHRPLVALDQRAARVRLAALRPPERDLVQLRLPPRRHSGGPGRRPGTWVGLVSRLGHVHAPLLVAPRGKFPARAPSCTGRRRGATTAAQRPARARPPPRRAPARRPGARPPGPRGRAPGRAGIGRSLFANQSQGDAILAGIVSESRRKSAIPDL